MSVAEENFLKESTEVLKTCRGMLWDSNYKYSTEILPYIEGICNIKSKLDKVRGSISEEVYENFVQEYNMTAYLFYTWAVQLKKEFASKIFESDMNKINVLIKNFSECIKSIEDLEAIKSLLNAEGITLIKEYNEGRALENKIESENVAAGYVSPSVLDGESNAGLKK